jgi:hypothetical protein
MKKPTKIDYSKLLGFDMVVDEISEGVDFNNPTVGARLGAKVGAPATKTEQPMLIHAPFEDTAPGAPIMQGLGGRKVSST